MKKRVLPLLMASSMMVSVTSPLFAQENEEQFDIHSTTEFVDEKQSFEKESAHEATANGKSYATLKEALKAGGEVKLLKNVTVDEIIEIQNDTTLDLGDFTITNNVTTARPFNVYANNFTVKANKGGMVIPESNSESYGFVNMYGQNLSILGGQYSGDTENGRLFIMRIPQGQESKIGTVFVKDIVAKTNCEIIGSNIQDTFQKFNGTISNSEFYTGTRAFCFPVSDKSETSTISISNTKVVAKRGPVIEASGGNTILSDNDWTVTGEYEGGDTWARTAVGVSNLGNVTIKSGNYSAKSQHMKQNEGYGVYVYTSGGSVNIEGGTFEGSTASLMAGIDYGDTSTIVVNGGQFTGDLLTDIHEGDAKITVNAGDFKGITDKTLVDGNNVQIDGGSFDKDVADKAPENKEIVAITRNGTPRYIFGERSVKEALSNTVPGDKVEIIQNITEVTVPGGVEVENKTDKDVTVNGTVIEKDETITTPAPSTGGGGSIVKLSPVYRAYNPNNGEHLYTLDEKEYKHVASVGWTAEGVAFMAEEEKNGQALYRVYNPNNGLHHYTLDEKEKNTLVALGWRDEKVAWYTSKKPQCAAVFRVYNPNGGQHHYTKDANERNVLVSLGWQDEGIAFRTAEIPSK